MKRCEYCGRENQDDAAACWGCGTERFEETNPPALPAQPEDTRAAPDAPVELQRCRDSETLEETTRLLDSAGITYQRSALPPMFDLGKIGAGDNPEVIVSVPRDAYATARAALESASLKLELPENHYLLTSTDEELVEIVAHASEWSAFDVAHARRLINERGIDLKKVEDKRLEQLHQLQRGRSASKNLIFFGWVFSLLGGLIGIGIASSLAYMKDKTPEGEFFTYDEKSRAIGKTMFRVAVGVSVTLLVIKFCFLAGR